MTDEEREGQPEAAEGSKAEELSEKVPDAAGGEGGTPLGASDEHSDAPGPHGLGDETT